MLHIMLHFYFSYLLGYIMYLLIFIKHTPFLRQWTGGTAAVSLKYQRRSVMALVGGIAAVVTRSTQPTVLYFVVDL